MPSCPYLETALAFGLEGQMKKAMEEALEFVTAMMKVIDEGGSLNNALWEMADFINVSRSVQAILPGVLETMCDTKMLRTQIRMRTGYYGDSIAAGLVRGPEVQERQGQQPGSAGVHQDHAENETGCGRVLELPQRRLD